jgi:hypothetical protein
VVRDMTLFDILVPVLALAVASVGLLIIHLTDPQRSKHTPADLG